MTIGVLAAYRRRGIARKLLRRVLENVDGGKDGLGEIVEIYLHVQSNNDEAIAFYRSHDFQIGELIKGYYKRIEPPDCYVLSKAIERGVAVANSAANPVSK